MTWSWWDYADWKNDEQRITDGLTEDTHGLTARRKSTGEEIGTIVRWASNDQIVLRTPDGHAEIWWDTHVYY